MNIQERIEAFNTNNAPFHIVDHEDGRFSLCLPLDFLSEEYHPYCQDAFNAYAAEIGEPAYNKHGLRLHGNGYEWEAAFRQAFADDPNIGRILFDSEAGGFFCDCDDLSLIEDFGKRFKEICEDTERFVPIVSEGIKNAKEREAAEERLLRTVKGQLMRRPDCTFDIMTPDGIVTVAPQDGKKLLCGETPQIKINGTYFAACELLEQEVTDFQMDLFDRKHIKLVTIEPEQELAPTLTM